MRGIVTRADTDGFTVRAGHEIYRCGSRGKVKRNGTIAVGDCVEFSLNAHGGVIESIEKRKSLLLRPRVANADLILAVVSPVPRPDLYTLDKILVNAERSDIPVAIVANKSDEDAGLFAALKEEYSGTVSEILSFSAKTGEGKKELLSLLRGKFAVLAGNSAAGKTSVVNAVLGLNLKTGDCSEKIMRGKQTTAYSEIFFGEADCGEESEVNSGEAGCGEKNGGESRNNSGEETFTDNLRQNGERMAGVSENKNEIMLADTPGFAAIDIDIVADELKDYYPEFVSAAGGCKFRGCTHTAEPFCAVKALVEEGKIPRGRYERYLNIYKELKERRTGYER